MTVQPDSQRAQRRTENRQFYRQLLTIVLPIAGQSLLTSLVSASDALMVGMIDQASLSAISLATQVQFVLSLFQAAFMIGASVLAAQYWGIRDRETVEKILALSLRVSLPVSAVFTLAALLMPQLLMRAFTSDALLISYGVVYLRIVSPSYLLLGFSQMYLNIMKNSGRVIKSSAFNSVGVVSNIVLNSVFIFGLLGMPALGIGGAAVATDLARLIEVVLCIIEDRRQDGIRLRACYFFPGTRFTPAGITRRRSHEACSAKQQAGRDDQVQATGAESTEGVLAQQADRAGTAGEDRRSRLTEDGGNGDNNKGDRDSVHRDRKTKDQVLARAYRRHMLPVLANEIAWGLGSTMFSVIMGHLGSDAVAANSVTNIIRNIAMSFCVGLGSGSAIMIGNLLGAGRLEEARTTSRRLIRAGVFFGAAAGLIVAALTPVILHFATTLTQTARGYLQWMLLMSSYYLIGRSLNGVLVEGTFCAGGDTRFGFLCDLINMWCFIIPLASLGAFVWKWPVMAVYFVLNLDEIVKIPFELVHYHKYKWLRNLTGKG